ncbi:hypothetical protein THAOC_17239 [Thalassiosira oceanica]|uniref:Uncharacterized protein n=1 Tax=Thalassiosira oceanica TaxID=159749 RepID=K0SAA7_THAOC|nr:hypothetical protein THAOC_17239 [Thalassiosira oceanica]|eukprot:EJK62160.1 hypothetical protein THAOC_17239 [Thalassiosira oceanica]
MDGPNTPSPLPSSLYSPVSATAMRSTKDSLVMAGMTSAFPSARNTTASGQGPGPGVLSPAGPRRVFLGTLALFQMICRSSSAGKGTGKERKTKEFLGGNGLSPIYFGGKWLRPDNAGACSGRPGGSQRKSRWLPVFNQIWTRTDRRSMTGVPVFGSPISTTLTVSTKLGFVGAYVFPISHHPRRRGPGGQRRSGLQSVAYVAVAAVFGQAGRSMATRPYRFHDVTDERRFFYTYTYSPAPSAGLSSFRRYPAAACAWRVALLGAGAPAPGA